MAKHMAGKRKSTTKKTRKQKKTVNIIFLICLIVFIYSSFQIILWIKSNAEIKNQEKSLAKEIIVEHQTDDGEKEKKINFDKLTRN